MDRRQAGKEVFCKGAKHDDRPGTRDQLNQDNQHRQSDRLRGYPSGQRVVEKRPGE
jgi:hypothetical protein